MQATTLCSGVMFSRHAGSLRRRRVQGRSQVAVKVQLEDFKAAANFASDRLPSLLDNLSAHITTRLFVLGDATESLVDAILPDKASSPDGGPALPDPSAAVEAVTDAASKNSGFFGFFADAFEQFLKVLDGGFAKLGVPYSYGFAIIAVTLLVKVATYPLTKKQVESTLALQSLQPRVKELQAKFANDAERLQVETAKLYQNAGVNPLAGCLPTLVTIPVFIGLYRALSNVADEGLLTEGFFWIPSLAGPTKLNGGLSWLWPVDGTPPLGWGQTIAYLVLPILLIISQYVSQKIITPQQNQNDQSAQQANAILKFMPLLIGWFSLNVPSGLTLYWFANNIITTAQQAYLRSKFEAPQLAGAGPIGTIVNPKEDEEEAKRPTGKELNARRSPRQLEASASGQGSDGGSRQGEKFRALKAREAAKRAALQAQQPGSGAEEGAAAAAAATPMPGSKFADIKAREAAARAGKGVEAAEAGSSSSNGNGSSKATEEAQAQPAVAVVEPEVIQPADGESHHSAKQQHEEEEGEQVVAEVHAVQQAEAGSPAKAAAAGAKKAGKKNGKKK
ncbi:hypothetical protein N2152v2_001197 [Parachlorella kessleri]